MSSDPTAPRLPNDALDLFLDGVLAELREPADSSALEEVRAAFRRRIPFPLRSYAAAVLILRAAGVSRGPAKQPAKDSPVSARPPRDHGRPQSAAAGAEKPPKRSEKARAKSAPAEERPSRKGSGPVGATNRADTAPRPKFKGEGTTIFFSMGKRQRLHPRALIDLLVDVAGVPLEDIGEVRAFDNYSFADLNPDAAQRVVTDLNGIELRGRRLSVNLAKKRDELVE